MSTDQLVGHLHRQNPRVIPRHNGHTMPPKCDPAVPESSPESGSVPGGEAMIHTAGDGRQPKFTDYLFALDMDVRWFLTVKAIEEHPIGAWNIGNRGHAIHLHAEVRNAQDVLHSIPDLSESASEPDCAPWSLSSVLASNARPELLPEAGARHERTLEAVSCSPMLGEGCPGVEHPQPASPFQRRCYSAAPRNSKNHSYRCFACGGTSLSLPWLHWQSHIVLSHPLLRA
jgi:hypothetical protein